MSRVNTQAFWIIVIIIVTFLLTAISLFFAKKTTKTTPEFKPQVVEVIVAQHTDEPVIISAFGTVQADQTITLRTEVSGRVVEKPQSLDRGEIVEKGEILLRIDPSDYLIIIEQEKAAVEQAFFELQLEKGRQIIAKREWEELGPSIKTMEFGEELVLRKPHLKEKEAALASATSRLKKANLDLKRTVIRSPMKAIVINTDVELGDYVTPAGELGTLVATGIFLIQVSVPASQLQWMTIPHGKKEKGSTAKIIQDLGNISVVREGEVVRLLGDLDTSGRMARLLVDVKDPLSLKDPTYRNFPLLLGSYVHVEIEGSPIKDVFVLPRKALHENNKVWVKNVDNQLEIRPVNLIQKREDVVIIDQGIANGEEIIISNIPLPIPGMQLRLTSP